MSTPNGLRSSQVSESKPVRALAGIGAALLAVVSALALVPGIPPWVPACVGAAGLAITAYLGKYTEDRTTPWEDVAAKTTPTGKVIAGPAASQPTGTTVAVVTDSVSPAYPAPQPDLPSPAAEDGL